MATYLKGHWPTPLAEKPSEQRVLGILYNQGFRTREELATAYAIVRAESGRDPKAYLAYVDIGTEKDYAAWKSRHPGKVALDEVKKDMKAIPTNLTPAAFKERLAALKLKYRLEPGSHTFDVLHWDRGLFQINSKYHGDLPASKAFTMYRNARKAREIYEGWDSTFNAWATFTNGRYKLTLPDAYKATDRFLKKQKAAA
jgi:hypothetical protein